ncbi:Uncharacterised protein [Mycobacteroides abscessus subsp. abscessus]|nr:Uncharacterised protein [Mycobacteroides abscessus subsp. abscessus]
MSGDLRHGVAHELPLDRAHAPVLAHHHVQHPLRRGRVRVPIVVVLTVVRFLCTSTTGEDPQRHDVVGGDDLALRRRNGLDRGTDHTVGADQNGALGELLSPQLTGERPHGVRLDSPALGGGRNRDPLRGAPPRLDSLTTLAVRDPVRDRLGGLARVGDHDGPGAELGIRDVLVVDLGESVELIGEGERGAAQLDAETLRDRAEPGSRRRDAQQRARELSLAHGALAQTQSGHRRVRNEVRVRSTVALVKPRTPAVSRAAEVHLRAAALGILVAPVLQSSLRIECQHLRPRHRVEVRAQLRGRLRDRSTFSNPLGEPAVQAFQTGRALDGRVEQPLGCVGNVLGVPHLMAAIRHVPMAPSRDECGGRHDRHAPGRGQHIDQAAVGDLGLRDVRQAPPAV